MSWNTIRLDSAAILARLAAGEVVLMATDTLPGLHARVDRSAALDALSALKGRAGGKPLLVLAASRNHALQLADIVSPATEAFLARCWPGPFTAILPAGKGLPAQVIGPVKSHEPGLPINHNGSDEPRASNVPNRTAPLVGTLAVRVPAWAELRNLLEASGPLASSSANRTKEPAPADLLRAAELFPDLPVWRSEPQTAAGAPSALVDLTGSQPHLLRPGPLPLPHWSGAIG